MTNKNLSIYKDMQGTLFPNVYYLDSNFFHGSVYKADDGSWKTYKTNPRYRTTIEQIRKGVRTQTTRSNSFKANIGDIIIFEDKGTARTHWRNGKRTGSWTAGQKVEVIITDIYPCSRETFLKYEGWDTSVWDNRKDQLLGKTSYRFKLI